MIFLPIVERELRVASRRRSTYRLRFWLALLALTVWFILLLTSRGSVERGKMLFIAVGVLAFAFSLLVGMF